MSRLSPPPGAPRNLLILVLDEVGGTFSRIAVKATPADVQLALLLGLRHIEVEKSVSDGHPVSPARGSARSKTPVSKVKVVDSLTDAERRRRERAANRAAAEGAKAARRRERARKASEKVEAKVERQREREHKKRLAVEHKERVALVRAQREWAKGRPETGDAVEFQAVARGRRAKGTVVAIIEDPERGRVLKVRGPVGTRIYPEAQVRRAR